MSPSIKTFPTCLPDCACLEIILDVIAFAEIPGLKLPPANINGGGNGATGGSGIENAVKIMLMTPVIVFKSILAVGVFI